ncbi:MAG TPA: FAD-binding oxidoreductase [Acidisarcina sp.]|nr:FAD-binding oxidoreductase [Acidisarcina sp.]
MARKNNPPKFESRFESWGRYPSLAATVVPLYWASDFPPPRAAEGTVSSPLRMLPVGMGRSYGDVCLIANGTLLDTRGLDRFQSLDEQTGVLRCEAGVTLDEILRLCVPRGWFLPVTPGTRYVTVGGAIANDVHGKNHHTAGTFGRYVRSLELARSDGSRFTCSPQQNVEWFRATIAGMGLTGLILSAEIQLRRIVSPLVRCEIRQFHGLDEFLSLSLAHQSTEYSLGWMDSTATGRNFARGVFMAATHSEVVEPLTPMPLRSWNLPLDLPGFVLNRGSVAACNALYFHLHRTRQQPRLLSYDRFFYPLDRLLHWNRLYGKRGFVQFQCVLPQAADPLAMLQLFKAISAARLTSFLAVLKVFGDAVSPGIMSFPMPGISLALDFPMRGEETLDLLGKLARITAEHGGRLYPAKDTQMTATQFQGFYPQWQQFAAYVDPAFRSSFWERVTARG